MNISSDFNEDTLVDMMFDSFSLDSFKSLWDKDKDSNKWGRLLYMCYCEEAYESVGGDDGDSDDPQINFERLEYLKKLIEFLRFFSNIITILRSNQ